MPVRASFRRQGSFPWRVIWIDKESFIPLKRQVFSPGWLERPWGVKNTEAVSPSMRRLLPRPHRSTLEDRP